MSLVPFWNFELPLQIILLVSMASGRQRGADSLMGDITVMSSNLPTNGSASLTSPTPRGPSLLGRTGGYDWTRHTRTYSVNIAGPGTTGTV